MHRARIAVVYEGAIKAHKTGRKREAKREAVLIPEKDAQKCFGFLEVVRTAVDNAEVHIASAIDSECSGRILGKASAEVEVAARNLVCVCNEITRICAEAIERLYDGTTINGITARIVVPPGPKTGCN